MLGDKDLLAFRQGYYDLFVSLLGQEPSPALLRGLADGMAERIRGSQGLHPLLAEGWEEMQRLLTGSAAQQVAEAVADEYTRLFVGPQPPEVNLYESFYLTGRLLDRPLVAVRAFLAEVGIRKEEGYAEPEDFLAFELEVMRRLIRRQATAADPEAEAEWIGRQAEFVVRHLLVWAPAAAADLEQAPGASFYRAVAKLLRAFLELERDLFKEQGAVRSLEEARQAAAGRGEWRGPLLDWADAPGGDPIPPPAPAR
ncbi:MAG: molecular chaperone [Candidatus Methylomirabilales bacterium]